MPTIKLYCHTGFANASHEDEIFIEDDIWDSMTDEQKENELQELARDFRDNNIDFGACVEEEE
jgi:hypothetical protein